MSIHFSGHTKGHVVYRVDDRFLFTGDALPWNHRRNEVDVAPSAEFGVHAAGFDR